MTPPRCPQLVFIFVLQVSCGRLHRQDVGNSVPAGDESTNAAYDASPRAPNDTAWSGNSPVSNSNTTTTSLSVQPPAAERCPDTPCPSDQCCVDGKQCGTYVFVGDFPDSCILRGDPDATLDDACPPHVCVDPRVRCTFSGCRTTSGKCGIWMDRYTYLAGEEGFVATVNLGCIVFPNE